MRHIERFKNSASLLSIAANFSLIESEVSRLAESLEGQDGYVYFQLSRGVDIMRSHMHKDDLEPERFGYALPLDFSASSLDILDAKLCDDIRWSNCHIKSTSLLGNTMQMNSARAEGCQEIIMHRDGLLTEAGACNVFYLDQSGCVRTSCTTENILPGITREILIEALEEHRVKLRIGHCAIQDFNTAQCAWLTSSTKGLLPLRIIKGTSYKLDINNAEFLAITELFNLKVESLLATGE